MSEQKKKAFGRTGFGLIIAAPFILFNPEYSIIDFIPDFLGYALILIALRKMRDVNAFFERSDSAFVKLFFLTAGKVGALILLFSGLFNESNRATAGLLFSFVFGLFEVILLRTAWKELFEGLGYLADGREEKLFRRAPALSAFTFVFVILKAVFSVLPEFSILSSHTYDEGHFDWSNFIWLFRVSAFIVAGIVGTVWLILTVVFFVRLRREVNTFEKADRLYEENVLSRPSLTVRRQIRAWTVAAATFFILLLDVSFDGVNVIPDFLAGVAALIAFIFLRDFSKLRLTGIIASGVFTAVSAVSWIASISFGTRWEFSDVYRLSEAWGAFWKYYPLKIAESVAAAVCSLAVLAAFRGIIRDHCGYVPVESGTQFAHQKLCEIRKSLFVRLNVCAVVSALSAVAAGFQDYAQTLPYLFRYVSKSDSLESRAAYFFSGLFGAWWAVSMAFGIISIILLFGLAGEIISESNSRYMLE